MQLLSVEVDTWDNMPKAVPRHRALQSEYADRGIPKYHRTLQEESDQQQGRPRFPKRAFRARLMAQEPLSMYSHHYEGAEFKTAFQQPAQDKVKFGRQTDRLTVDNLVLHTHQAAKPESEVNSRQLMLSPRQEMAHNHPETSFVKELTQPDEFMELLCPQQYGMVAEGSPTRSKIAKSDQNKGLQTMLTQGDQNGSMTYLRDHKTSEEIRFGGVTQGIDLQRDSLRSQLEDGPSQRLRGDRFGHSVPPESTIRENESRLNTLQERNFTRKEIKEGKHIDRSEFQGDRRSRPRQEESKPKEWPHSYFGPKRFEAPRPPLYGHDHDLFRPAISETRQAIQAERQRPREYLRFKNAPKEDMRLGSAQLIQHDIATSIRLAKRAQCNTENQNAEYNMASKLDSAMQSFGDNDWNDANVLIPQKHSSQPKSNFKPRPFDTQKLNINIRRDAQEMSDLNSNSSLNVRSYSRMRPQRQKVNSLASQRLDVLDSFKQQDKT